jgi:deoxyhypusine synthase
MFFLEKIAAWLRAIEAQRMDNILMESDKYLSIDSSIDDLLTDALSKRRARSIG